jgi:hypothetical protein
MKLGNSVYTLRIGPLDPETPNLYLYATLPHAAHPPIAADDPRQGLMEVARRFPDHELRCEPKLALAGCAGFKPRNPTQEEAMLASLIWLSVAFSDSYRKIGDLDARTLLLVYSANLRDRMQRVPSVIEVKLDLVGQAKDHQLNETRFVVIGSDWGILAFDSRDEMEVYQRCARAQDAEGAASIRRMQMHWQRGPDRQRALLQTGFRTDVTPIASYDQGDSSQPLDDRDAWILVFLLAALGQEPYRG